MTDPNESSIEARRTASSRSRTRRPVRKDEKAAAIRPRFRGVSASSAAPRAQSGISEPSAPRTAPTARGMVVVTTAAESERAAVTHSVFTPPTAPMRNAATAGPTMVMSESMDWLSPRYRCRSMPSRRDTAGASVSRAVMPGMSPTAPSTPNTANQAKSSPHSRSTTGSSATLTAETTSETMDTLRRLNRSSTAPPKTPNITWGMAQTSASVPAARASPVVARTMSGRAMPATEFPKSDRAFETRNRMDVP